MSQTKPYRGYRGTVEYSHEDGVLFGKVIGIRDLVNYEAETAKEIEPAFKCAVDTYIADCEAAGEQPNKPFTGSLNVRISSEVHEDLFIIATQKNKKLNTVIAEFLAESVKKAKKLA